MRTKEECLELMRNEPVFWSRLGFGYDPPIRRDGKIVIFNENYGEYRRVHDDFSRAGIRIHTCILQSGWIGIDEYDYSATDRALDELLSGAPDRLFIPRVKLNVPPEWCRENPEEVFVYYGGPGTAAEIASAACGPRHDWFGMEMPSGYPTNGGTGFRDDRPNVGGVIGLQSFSSNKWLHDAGEALTRFIEHLENGPYADQIIGYHVAHGMCGETSLWGAWQPGGKNRRGDYGIGHRRAFIEWGLKRYAGEEALREAWKVAVDIPLTEIRVPCPNDRESCGTSLAKDFYADAPIMKDYNEFLSEKNVDAIEYFGQIVHEKSHKPAGAFYGYLMVPQAANAGHLAVERILASEHVDFLASPKSYIYHTVGEPGGEQSLSRSYNRKKLWLDEVDNRTHLERRGTSDMTHSMDETLTVLWREFAKNIVSDQNFWWMDLGEGWFDDPEIMDNIAQMYRVQKELIRTPHRSVSEVLLVADENSIMNCRVSYGLSEGLLKRVDREAKLAGAPVDMFRLNDLRDLPMENYKVIIFLNCYRMPAELWQTVRSRIRTGASLVWHYAPGIQNPEFGVEHVRELTGFGVREGQGYSQYLYENAEKDFTPVRVEEEEGIRAILRAQDGIVYAERTREDGGLSYLAAEPMLTDKELRCVYERAGVNLYVRQSCTVYADNRLLSVFSHEEDINEDLCLPHAMTLVDLITGERHEQVTRLRLQLPARRGKIYRVTTTDE